MGNHKTNATRILEQHKIPYELLTYPHRDGVFCDGITVANLINRPPETVFKTLVAQGASGEFLVFMIPVADELDLKKAARAVGEKSIDLIPVNLLTKVTGYLRGGCSPIGMKKLFRTTVDRSALDYPNIIFSAGRIGYQLVTAPADLAKVIKCTFADICHAGS